MLPQCGAVSLIKTLSLTPDCQSMKTITITAPHNNKECWGKKHPCLQATFSIGLHHLSSYYASILLHKHNPSSTSTSTINAHKHYVLCLCFVPCIGQLHVQRVRPLSCSAMIGLQLQTLILSSSGSE